MTRVSENSSTDAFKFSLGKTKSKVEDLQLKGGSLKKINKSLKFCQEVKKI